jgi:hypothetical protein
MIGTRSASTALNKHKGLQQFFKWLLAEEGMHRSPTERVPQSKGARALTAIHLGLPNPLAQRLAADAQLVCHRGYRRPLGVVVRHRLGDQAHRPGPGVSRVPAR